VSTYSTYQIHARRPLIVVRVLLYVRLLLLQSVSKAARSLSSAMTRFSRIPMNNSYRARAIARVQTQYATGGRAYILH
jgi:hypothetical protein